MKLTPPKNITWWIAVTLGVLAFLGQTHTIPALSPFAFFLVLAGLILLIVACFVRKLYKVIMPVALGLKNRSESPGYMIYLLIN